MDRGTYIDNSHRIRYPINIVRRVCLYTLFEKENLLFGGEIRYVYSKRDL